MVGALAALGRRERAAALLQMLGPVHHTRTAEAVAVYRVEPYVVAADVYGAPPHVGRGGWTWYTGAAAWTYRVWLEEILGFRRRGDTLTIDPVIPKDWPGFRLRYRFQNTTYRISVENPERCSRGVTVVELDGVVVANKIVMLRNDELPHEVRIVLGSKPPT